MDNVADFGRNGNRAVVEEMDGESNPYPATRIAPSKGWGSLRFGELWTYRELLYSLVLRDMKVRYRQTFLGVSWAILQPVISMVVFSLFFGRLAGMSSEGAPYPAFSITGLVPWTFFSATVSLAALSLVNSAQMLSKVYFPRLMIPASAVAAGVVDLAIASLVMFVILAVFGIYPNLRVLALPLFVLLAIITSLGVSLWLSALNVRFRDVRYAVPFLLQIWLFATPVAYSIEIIPQQWRWLYALNPMVSVVGGFRWSLLGSDTFSAGMLAISTAVALLALFGGILYFRRMERTFADVV